MPATLSFGPRYTLNPNEVYALPVKAGTVTVTPPTTPLETSVNQSQWNPLTLNSSGAAAFSGKFLRTSASDAMVSLAPFNKVDIPTATDLSTPPGGIAGQVQFNDSGAFAGDSGLTYDKANDALNVVGAVAIGATPATTGALRLGNGYGPGIWARNAANNGNVSVAHVNGANIVNIGDEPPGIHLNSAANYVGAASAGQHATTGVIRLQNNQSINARNVGNNGDINLLLLDTGNYISLGVGGGIPGVKIPSGRLVFPATQIPSAEVNALDDYKEGTFTPTLTGSGGGSGQTYSGQFGEYVKIGKRVYFGLAITLTAKGTITGLLQVSNLPYSVDATGAPGGNLGAFNIGYFSGLAGAVAGVFAVGQGNNIGLFFLPAAGAQVTNPMDGTSITDLFTLWMSGHYRTAN